MSYLPRLPPHRWTKQCSAYSIRKPARALCQFRGQCPPNLRVVLIEDAKIKESAASSPLTPSAVDIALKKEKPRRVGLPDTGGIKAVPRKERTRRPS